MTAPAQQPVSGRAGLPGRLLAAVRIEFRAGILVPAADDPVLGRPDCPAAGCGRPRAENGLCTAHGHRREDRGRPDMTGFLAGPGPPLNGRRPLTACPVPGCRYGSSGRGLCMRHRPAWEYAGCPDPVAWAARAGPPAAQPRAECLLPFCTLWTGNQARRFCKARDTRWRQLGSPDPGEFTGHCLLRGRARIDFRGLPAQLRLEMQYAVQWRAAITLPHQAARWAVRQAGEAGVESLPGLSGDEWRQQAGRGKSPACPAFVLFAREMAGELAEGTGWEAGYSRDAWRLHRIPGLVLNPGKPASSRIRLRFGRLAQPWLRDLSKRRARLRLSPGLSVGTVQPDVAALTRFSEFPTITSTLALGGVDRPLPERYLAWLAGRAIGLGARTGAITSVSAFLQAIRQHGWDATLPVTAAFFPGGIPARPPQLTRHLAGHIMTQAESPANLDRWSCPEGRLITLILIRCGLRAAGACTLASDCLIHDGQGAPYLRCFNHKMRREAAVPAGGEPEAAIRGQQQRAADRWPGRHPHLFPALKASAGGQHPVTCYSYRGLLNKWLDTCDVRGEHGSPVHLTPRQRRHTFACRLINRDVPQEAVRVLPGHSSAQMTAHYAKLTDQAVRRRWEQATRVNISGERVTIDPDGPLGQAQRAKAGYGIATQTLPNGYCGLPVQRQCPHANSCLTCPVFLTGPGFLPELREQQQRTLTLITTARDNGHVRVTEMNEQAAANPDPMITELEAVTPDEQEDAANAG
jgi:integrase/ferredoxin